LDINDCKPNGLGIDKMSTDPADPAAGPQQGLRYIAEDHLFASKGWILSHSFRIHKQQARSRFLDLQRYALLPRAYQGIGNKECTS
jgi:hypothetical protein